MDQDSSSGFRRFFRQLRLGVLLYNVYHNPRLAMRRGWGGPLDRGFAWRGRKQIFAAARSLAPFDIPPDAEGHEVHFLSGERFWPLTVFCAYSMQAYSPDVIRPVVHGDGTLEEHVGAEITRLLPQTRIVRESETLEMLDRRLPRDRYPVLRRLRDRHVNCRKLFDIHPGQTGWTLVLDSDMIFHREPRSMLEWLRHPGGGIHLMDCATVYAESPERIHELLGVKMPERLNAGVVGINSGEIDWDWLERQCAVLFSEPASERYVDQTCTTLLMSQISHRVLPPEDYRILPTRYEALHPPGVMTHYIAGSKLFYYRYGWKVARASLLALAKGKLNADGKWNPLALTEARPAP